MHASFDELESTLESDEFEFKEIEWGDVHVGIETYRELFDNSPYLKGLPNDRCQCPHWGYVLEGRMLVRYGDREETIEAGEVYYIEPGHLITMEGGSRIVEFSPSAEFQRTMEVATKNYERLRR